MTSFCLPTLRHRDSLVQMARAAHAKSSGSDERFPSEAHFASFLGLCPDNQITGGCSAGAPGTSRTVRPPPYAWPPPVSGAVRPTWEPSSAVCEHVWVHRKPSRPANILARLVYRMLRYREQYVDKGINYYEDKYREHEIRSIQKEAKDLGFVVTLSPAAA